MGMESICNDDDDNDDNDYDDDDDDDDVWRWMQKFVI